eukprot:1590163-Rhodomonas_salina.2
MFSDLQAVVQGPDVRMGPPFLVYMPLADSHRGLNHALKELDQGFGCAVHVCSQHAHSNNALCQDCLVLEAWLEGLHQDGMPVDVRAVLLSRRSKCIARRQSLQASSFDLPVSENPLQRRELVFVGLKQYSMTVP